MKLRETLPRILLGLLGIVAAAGISLAANEVSGGEIALSADPVFEVDDERLVEPDDRVNKDRNERDDRGSEANLEDDGGASGSDDPSGEPGEDRSGTDRDPPEADVVEIEVPDQDNSGSGSSSSGSGSSGSGSSGSGSGGNSGPGGGDD